MAVAVEDVLAKAGLDRFSSNFTSQGFITGESLMLLTMQDYGKFGIIQTEDRRKLFQIIQQQKQVKNQDSGTNKRMSSVIARLTSSEKRSKEKREAPIDPTPPNSMYFNRATFLRRSFNKSKGSDTEPSLPKQQLSVRERRATAGSTNQSFNLNRKGSLSASAENINKYRNCQNGTQNGSSPLRKSASGRTDFNHRSTNDDAPALRVRSKTTSIIGTTTLSPRKAFKSSDKIKVCVRKRPLNKKERTRSEEDIINVFKPNECHVLETKTSVDCTKYIQKHCYVFDAVFDETSNNEDVYEESAKPLVEWIFLGNKATCFAYGQTGSGKTYTMTGTKNIEGIVMLAAKDIFQTIASQKYGDDFNVFVSFYEIYCGQLFDLINKRKRLNALENAKKTICIVGLEEKQVYSHKDIIDLVKQGGHRRSSGSTSVNTESSRSHAILQVELKSSKGKPRGKFSFIDLAGSERAADVSDSNKQTRLEGAEINTSLLALKECIRALDLESKHTPFRQSKLTQVLRDSFLGNSKTCMIASISPNILSCENTLNTLRYADRVKELGREPDKASELDTSQLLSATSDHLPSDISLLDKTEEDGVSDNEHNYLSAVDNSIATIEQLISNPNDDHDNSCDSRTSSGEENEAPVQKYSKAVNEISVTPATPVKRSPSAPPRKSSSPSSAPAKKPPPPREETKREYPKPPATAPPKVHDSSDTETLSHPSSAWMERSKTMASSPRMRKVKPEDKMRKAQDDLVASHQIHISQVTNLCSVEAELLQTFVDGGLEFPEYMKKLESILESKNKCVESLRAQVACYSLRAMY